MNWKLATAVAAVLLLLFGVWFGFTRTPSSQPISLDSNNQILESFYKDESAYQEAFANAVNLSPSPAYAAVTSHHFLAKSLIAKTLVSVDPTKVKTVILISPDHFDALSNSSFLGVTAPNNWNTPFGLVEPNPAQIDVITSLPTIQENVSPFLKEHGIYTLIPFIKKQFPNATVVPIILRQSSIFVNYNQLGKNLHQFFNPDETLLLVSSDFSHNKTPEIALIDDQLSITALQNHLMSDPSQISSDCQVCMAVLFGYLDGLPTQFQLLENKNSFDISGESATDVTSYVSGLFTKEGQAPIWTPYIISTPTGQTSPSPSPTPEPIKLLFGGDMMFDRNIRQRMEQYGSDHILKELVPLFRQYTAVIANLEGPVTPNKSRSVGSAPGSTNNFIFTFDPSLAKTLYDQHVRVVNLGNNHILNQGKEGVTQSKQYLTEANIQFFGDTTMETESKERTLILNLSGVKIGFVNYNQFVTGGFENAVADLQYIRPLADIVVVHPHWGNEYQPTANARIVSDAHRFIDEGADLIIGAHPHVIQNKEVYKEKTIYYSLGNLVFDQYFSPEVKAGMLVGVTIDPVTKQMSFEEFHTELQLNGQTILTDKK